MMHDRAREYVARYAKPDAGSVLEIGSRNVNGGVRDLWPGSDYLGCDILPGKGIDVVCDAATHQFGRLFDVVVSTEVLEHAVTWRQIVHNAARHLKPGGRLILTCAGPGRPEHSAKGGRADVDEWYCNVHPCELYDEMVAAGIMVDSIELLMTDTRASGVKS